MIKLIRLDSPTADLLTLVKELDQGLAITDGSEHQFYNQYNGLEGITHFIIAYQETRPIGCGAFKEFASKTIEVKRMYTNPEYRGKGVATSILAALEEWANEEGFCFSVLETGKRQHEAIKLYQKNGYTLIKNYGQYANATNSLCFKKDI